MSLPLDIRGAKACRRVRPTSKLENLNLFNFQASAKVAFNTDSIYALRACLRGIVLYVTLLQPVRSVAQVSVLSNLLTTRKTVKLYVRS